MSTRRWVLIAVAVVAVSLGAAVAGGDGPQASDFNPLTDDPNPPPPPSSKAADVGQEDAPRDGSQTTHTHPPEPDGEEDSNISGDPDMWGCMTPDGIGHGMLIHRPSMEMLKIMRDDIASRRTSDPEYTPTLDLSDFDFPEDCVPMDGMPSLEEYVTARSSLAVINPDGTLKSDAELAEIVGPDGS